MKKLLIMLLVLALFSHLIEAKVVNITKTDFNIEPIQAYRLEEGDGISFIRENKEYVISMDDVGNGSARLKSFAYKNDTRETFYILISKKYSNKVDFEKDDIYDMKVSLIEINDNMTNAAVMFELLNEPKPVINKNETNSNTNNELKTGLIIIASIVILGLIIYFILKKKK
jgi:hypothetical protein